MSLKVNPTKANHRLGGLVGETEPAPAEKKDAKSLLSKLASGKKTVTKKKSETRPTLELSQEAQDLFSSWVPAKILAETFTEHADARKSEVEEIVFNSYVDTMWKQKAQPTNPTISSTKNGKADSSATYIVQERYTVQVPNLGAEDDPAQKLVEVLVDGGVGEEEAATLVENEIDVTPYVGIRGFNELTNGHKESKDWIPATETEKAAAAKIMAFVQGEESDPLTEEERDAALEIKPRFEVKSGFLQRVCNYVNTSDQLKTVFKVIKPVHYPKGAKFGISDSMDERNQRLVREAAGILGVELDD